MVGCVPPTRGVQGLVDGARAGRHAWCGGRCLMDGIGPEPQIRTRCYHGGGPEPIMVLHPHAIRSCRIANAVVCPKCTCPEVSMTVRQRLLSSLVVIAIC